MDARTPARLHSRAVRNRLRRGGRAGGGDEPGGGAYRLRRRPDAAAFRAAWDVALAVSYDRLEEAALGRALNGVPVPIVHRGEQVAERRHFDEWLTVYLLKRRDERLVQEGLRRKGSFIKIDREWLADALQKALGRIGLPSREA